MTRTSPEKTEVWLLDDGGSDQKCADPNPEKAKAARERRRELTALAEAVVVAFFGGRKELRDQPVP